MVLLEGCLYLGWVDSEDDDDDLPLNNTLVVVPLSTSFTLEGSLDWSTVPVARFHPASTVSSLRPRPQ
jgi:hypothetical protein